MSNAPKNHPGAARIAIVGGGLSGVATAVRLVGSLSPVTRRILIVESAPRIGRGVAYRTENDVHLLNVPAGRMSPIPGEPRHFLNWVQARVADATGGSFVPRGLFGAYLEEILAAAGAAVPPGSECLMHAGRVVRIELAGEGARIELADGSSSFADRVVLATGHLPPSVPAAIGPEVVADPRFVADPWDAGWALRVPREAAVLFIGTGLTMVDAVLELRGAGHTGSIRAVSRHGLMPEAHRGLPRDPGRLPPPSALASVQPAIAEYLRAVRAAIREAEDAGGDWRDIFGALRPITPVLWQRLPSLERARFLRHVRSTWDAHRHRAAPEVALRIAVLRAKRTLQVSAGRLGAIEVRGEGLAVRVHSRGGGEEEFTVGAVVCCTGPDTNLARANDPLMRSLLESGLIHQDPEKIGIETGPSGETIARDGTVSGTIYYVGPMLRAGWWEATAVPELAEHAARTADAVLRSL